MFFGNIVYYDIFTQLSREKQTQTIASKGNYQMEDENKNLMIEKFNNARYFDYLLGGNHNFEADRAAGDLILKIAPDSRLGALANRAFLRRIVRYLSQQGINQFIDFGSGIPTVGNVHEVAQKINPTAHTVYVDYDPVAVIHSNSILKDDPITAVVEEDFLNIETLFQKIKRTGLIDLNKPVGVLLISVMHFVPDDEKAYGLLRSIYSMIKPGSYVALSHYCLDHVPQSTIEQIENIGKFSSSSNKARTQNEIERFFDGFTMIDPGVVCVPRWQPEADDELLAQEPERSMSYCGLGMKK